MNAHDLDRMMAIMVHDKEKLFDILSDFKLVMIRVGDSVYRITRECIVDKEYRYKDGDNNEST
jgi:hypothetical protein